MFIVDFWDSIVTFLGSYSLSRLLSIFWFFFYVEVPRYYLFEFIIIFYRKIRHKYYKKRHALARIKLYNNMPFITILVPGKNEGKNIYKLVTSLSEQTYKNYEIIIVDDGSDDFSPEICRDLEKHGYIDLFLRNEESGGKASAANFGLNYAKGDYVIHIDADSSLDRNAIEEILIPFYYNKEIKAVGGCVKVRNLYENYCTSFQALEYLKTIMVGRMVTSTLGIYRTISGAFGAFETKMLRQVGGWDVGPGMDGDITQKFRKAGGKIHFEEKSICLTSVPNKFIALRNQRYRWSKSLVRFRLRRHIDVLMPNANFNFVNFFSNLENIVFNFVFDAFWLVYLLVLIVNNQGFLLEILFLKFIIMCFFSFFSFLMVMWVTERRREEFALISIVPFMTFYTGFFLRFVKIQAYIAEFFFFSSYKDPWNPRKTSNIARYYDLAGSTSLEDGPESEAKRAKKRRRQK